MNTICQDRCFGKSLPGARLREAEPTQGNYQMMS